MSARPWMPLYVAEYMADTAHLGALESGAYLHLIFYYWQTGGLPAEDKELARIAKVSSHCWKKLGPVIQKFFHDGWKHKRVEEELARASAISEKRRDAVNARRDRKPSNEPTNVEQKKTHLQSHRQREEESKKEPSLCSGAQIVRRETNPDWPADAFEQFYTAYPRKTEKIDAQKAFEKVRKKHRVPWPDFITSVGRYAAVADPQFTKHPSTWLNKGCWADQQQKNGHRSPNGSSKSGGADFFAGLKEVAANIAGDGAVAGPAAEEIPLGRVNLDG